MKLRKDTPDELLRGAGVYDLDPNIGILSSQAGVLLNRGKTRMDSDRREGRPPPSYRDGSSKVLYRLGEVLKARAESQGKTLEQTRKEAADEKRGWPSFQGFMAVSGKDTWPIAQLQGLPVDFFSTLDMDLDEHDIGSPFGSDEFVTEDMTRKEFIKRRVAFFQERTRNYGTAPTAIGKQWANALHMATSLKEGWDRGYQQALTIVINENLATTVSEQRERKRQREEMEHSADYQGVRQALDAAPDEIFMSRNTAQFYLGMSPGVFKKALERGPHPFAEPRGGATKGEVDQWFHDMLKIKHADVMPNVQPLRVSRDLSSGRPYLVDISGTIMADGQISNLDPRDVAYAASIGAGIQILSLSSALAQPWRDPVERNMWAGLREFLLEQKVLKVNKAVAKAKDQDMKAMTARSFGTE